MAWIEQLEERPYKSEQHFRCDVIEIYGLIQEENENVQLIRKVRDAIGIKVEENMIDVCHRLGRRKRSEQST